MKHKVSTFTFQLSSQKTACYISKPILNMMLHVQNLRRKLS